jgi:hypothetical protein
MTGESASDRLEARYASAPTHDERLRKALEELRSFVAIMVGIGPEARIPETIRAPLGVDVKIGAIMRAADAALVSTPVSDKPEGEALDRLESSDDLAVRRAIVAAEQAAFESYLSEYVLSTEGPDYEPTEWERSLIEDAIQGYLVERGKAVRETLSSLPTDKRAK